MSLLALLSAANELLKRIPGVKPARVALAAFQLWYTGVILIPTFAKVSLILALLYFVSPIDIIPDFIPIVGFLDDIGILTYVAYSVLNYQFILNLITNVPTIIQLPSANQQPVLIAPNNAQANAFVEETCVVCLENSSSIRFNDCNHQICCSDCSQSLNQCPFCRKLILNKVYVQS
jgi:uncharacterized membrane protein YkvA (DUF1232 family)